MTWGDPELGQSVTRLFVDGVQELSGLACFTPLRAGGGVGFYSHIVVVGDSNGLYLLFFVAG